MLIWACVTLTMDAETRPEKMLFDFTTSTDSSPWQIVNDDVMGGVSSSGFQILTNGGAIFSGAVSVENNGGFASVRSLPAPHDLTGRDCFIVRVRGDGRRYKFTVRTRAGFDTPIFQCAFTSKPGQWEEHKLPFKDFVPTFRGRLLTTEPPLNPAEVVSVGFLIADKQDGPFRLEIASIRAASQAKTRNQAN
jgi:hypothetical protein